MTTQHSEGLALEQKTEPVPSSDKMALDLDINGTSSRDESKIDQQSPSAIELNKPSEILSTVSAEINSAFAPGVNGDLNAKAHSLNSSMAASTIVESSAQVEQTSETEILSQLPDSNTTVDSAEPVEVSKPASIEEENNTPNSADSADAIIESEDMNHNNLPTFADAVIESEEKDHNDLPTSANAIIESEEKDHTADLPTSADAMMESAVENTTIETTVLPIVEAPVSDLREDISPLTKDPSQSLREPSIPPVESKESEPIAKEDKTSEPIPEDNTKETPATNAKPADENEVQAPDPMVEDIKEADAVEDMNLTFDAPRADLPPSSPNNGAPSVDMDTSPRPQSQPEQTNTETVANPPESSALSNDVDMIDAPEQSQTTKVAREREDDSDMQPSAKRTKTEESEERDAPVVPNGSHIATPVSQNGAKDNLILTADVKLQINTPHVTREIVKIIKNSLKTQSGKNFKAPVAVLWPGVAKDYAERVPNEIDLGAIEKKLRNNEYSVYGDLLADLDLQYNNAVAFNGSEHAITEAAADVRKYIDFRVDHLSPEPPAVAKPIKKAKRPTPTADTPARAPLARRPSKGATNAALPAINTSSATTFALDPVTSTPLIRRDSTKDGRPKREIHPPKNKDLPYSSVRPKSKKFSTELKWCEEVLSELKKAKHLAYSSPFLQPVDPVALQIPNYFTVIKNPMDISVVSEKLHNGVYARAKDFESDVRLIFHNCYKFNPEGNAVRMMGREFEKVFNEVMAKKDRWIAEHQPQAASPEREVESEDEESEEEAPPAPGPSTSSTSHAQMTERLLEEQNKLIDMLSRGDDPDLIKMQKEMVNIIKKRVDDIISATAVAGPAKKPSSKKTKSTKPTKKIAPQGKKAASGTTKKSGGSRPNRDRYMGTIEKEVISNGIGALPEHISTSVMALIKEDQPNITTDDDGTLELDIDQISVAVLWKIYDYIKLHVPEVEANVRETYDKKDDARVPAKPPQKKKNKPMSKNEQERKIAQLRDKMQEFRGAGSRSQEPIESVETQQQEESSGDESSDSEEE